jgi:DNA-binding NarL/FixJ family response regulator
MDARFRLLIVDDSKPICLLVVHMLKTSEFDVVGTASTSAEAIQLATSLQPDVVLLDRELPDDQNFATLKTLVEICPHARVVIFSGDFGADVVSRAAALGASGYVQKGGSNLNLLRALRLAASSPSIHKTI